MTNVKLRVWVNCAQCSKRFSLQISDHKKRLQHSKTGGLYCSRVCFDVAKSAQKLTKGVA